MSKLSVENLTKELKDVLLKTKKELKNRDNTIKKTKTIQDLTKKEYQTFFDENVKLKKKIQQYETYYKTQQLEKKRREKTILKNKKKSFNVGKKNRMTNCQC